MLAHGIGRLGAPVVALDILLTHPGPQSPVRPAAEYRALGHDEAAQALK